MSTPDNVKDQIIRELGTACQLLGCESSLSAIVNSYGDTMDAQSTLEMLYDWNSGGVVHHQHPYAENMLRSLLVSLGHDRASNCDADELQETWQRAMQPHWKAYCQ